MLSLTKYKELLILHNRIQEYIFKDFDKHNVTDEEGIYVLTRITANLTMEYMDRKIEKELEEEK
jgi:hypothetical protein